MNHADPRFLLDRHAARVLARWRERLRALPPSSALANPDLLAPLMAPALARVRQEAAGAPVGSPADLVACACGLNPLMAFYVTGECATMDVLWGHGEALLNLSPGERENVCRALNLAWRRVAADEIALFCSVCQHGTKPTAISGHSARHSTPHTRAACETARPIRRAAAVSA